MRDATIEVVPVETVASDAHALPPMGYHPLAVPPQFLSHGQHGQRFGPASTWMD